MPLEAMRRFAWMAESYPAGSPEAEEFAALEAMAAARDAYYQNPTPDHDKAWAIAQAIWEKALKRIEG